MSDIKIMNWVIKNKKLISVVGLIIAMPLGVIQSLNAAEQSSLILSGTDFGVSGTKVPSHAICPQEITPSFSWEGAPEGTKAYVLTMHAPTFTEEEIAAGAEQRPFKYWWILYNIPGSSSSVEAGGTAAGTLGTNIAKGEPTVGYSPPCPQGGGTDIPIAFTLFALSQELDLPKPIEVTWDALTNAMQDKLLASTTIRASFDRILPETE